MGSLQNGLFGGFKGRVGNLVGYELNGKNVIRTIGHSGKPLSPARKINCDRMTIVNHFLRPIQSFIKPGFRLKIVGTDRNYYNEAVSYNKKHAVSGEFPNAQMDYPKAMLSMGTLLKADKPQIKLVGTEIEFSWEVPADLPWRNLNDRAMVLLYWPDQHQHTHCLSGSHRKDGKHRIQIDPNLANQRVEAYISFINDDASEISDSVYAGSINKKKLETAPILENTDSQKKKETSLVKGFKAIPEPLTSTKTRQKNKITTPLKTSYSGKLKEAASPFANPQIPDTPDHPTLGYRRKT